MYELFVRLQTIFDDNNIDASKTNFSDIFEIIDKDGKTLNMEGDHEKYLEDGKRVLFEYFIDTLLC